MPILNISTQELLELAAIKWGIPVYNIRIIELDEDSIFLIIELDEDSIFLDELNSILKNGSKLHAIKVLRDYSGLTLLDAKEWIDSYEANKSLKLPPRMLPFSQDLAPNKD